MIDCCFISGLVFSRFHPQIVVDNDFLNNRGFFHNGWLKVSSGGGIDGGVPLRRLLLRRDGGKSVGSLTSGLFIRAMKSSAKEKSDGGDGYR
ncbi:hypothetical protein L6452_44103 [Arctium lappa]|uniref:Uncharacterized protein n=1 Tax=Arctium lappa TaxID=4217 RepID=A0ACB8XF88_ARCLA|nr:hypothetical protein L6452_44103 [Arctium lappa]